jgi:hypothetical protein
MKEKLLSVRNEDLFPATVSLLRLEGESKEKMIRQARAERKKN